MTAAPTAPGRLERRKARTRAAILDAANRLFHEQGFEDTSIQQIAELADTGVGTLYGYFASKEDLLREVLRVSRDDAVARYRAAVAGDTPAIDRVCTALGTMAEYLEAHRRLLVSVFRLAARNQSFEDDYAEWLQRSFAELIESGIRSGEFRPVPADAAARMLITTMMTASLGIGAWAGRAGDPTAMVEIQQLARALLLR
ncbi:TetR/AcrR family transcriptional regulator [Tepidiforma sp.]|jgi:AcrR family transcriptional regulator|uniref:TetR/AcrR family transcriptional regulator n=1 Tax=Tepidiforma sp. TaxID=2682230 RepID=UPI00261674B6|nr:TetR/AcrR family transcriptional regulator [Tepidiforma sp.]MCX7616652.1 TetR/AcrR family transcriptional regulator [Tepidiforma sp.]